MTSLFRDEVAYVSDWFLSWNECEQVVALYSLLRKITSTQARFLLQVLEHILRNYTDDDFQENRANDPAYISGLYKESKDTAVSQLLKCLPLLKEGNVNAKMEYLRIMPMIMKHSVDNGCHVEECKQLLSYSLIHPALSRDELSNLTVWLNSLEESSSSTSADKQKLQQPKSFVTLSSSSGSSSSSSSSSSSQVALPSQLTGIEASWSGMTTFTEKNNGTNAFLANGLMSLQPRYQHEMTMTTSDSSTAPSSSVDFICNHPTETIASSQSIIGARNNRMLLTASASVPLSHDNNAFIGCNNDHHHHQLLSSSNQRKTCPAALSQVSHVQKSESHHQKLTRTASLVPPQPNVALPSVSDWLNRHHMEPVENATSFSSSSSGRLPPPPSHLHHHHHHLFVSPSSSDVFHAPLSPQSSITSSGSGGSDNHHEDIRRTRSGNSKDDSGMKDVSIWLKTLRLHKYSYLFQQISYDEMMNLTDEWLEGQGVTKGARNKIIISVGKLKERQETLRSLEKDLQEMTSSSGNLKHTMTEIRHLLNTPIKYFSPPLESIARKKKMEQDEHQQQIVNSLSDDVNSRKEPVCSTSSSSSCGGQLSPGGGGGGGGGEGDSIADGDIPGQMTRLLGKVCTQLLVTIRPDGDCLIIYQQILDKCMNHSGFTVEEKKKMSSWRQQIHRVWQFLLQKQNTDRHRSGSNIILNRSGGSTTTTQRTPLTRRQFTTTPGQPTWTFGGPTNRTSQTLGFATHQHQQQQQLTAQMSLPHPPSHTSSSSSSSSGFITSSSFSPQQQQQRSSVEISPVKQPLSRTQSAPIKSVPMTTLPMSTKPMAETPELSVNEDIHASLDSLCISMMEHALGN